MNRWIARLTFAAIVAATFGAFFVAQRLKRTPPLVGSVKRTAFFSPNGDGVRDHAVLSFKLKRDDDVRVAIVSHDGDVVRTLAEARHMDAYQRERFVWNGRDDAGRRVPDGRYRPRIGLRRQGRSVTVPSAIVLDTTPPRPASIVGAPDRPAGPLIVPESDPGLTGAPAGVRIAFRGPARAGATVRIYRTDLQRARQVVTLPIARGRHSTTWDGLVDGRPAPQGTYLAAVTVTDRAGNTGSDPGGLPPSPGSRVRGRAGITVRRLAAQGPLGPATAGSDALVFVDSRKAPYRWQVRRIGSGSPRKGSVASRPRLRFQAPRGESGIYLVELSQRRAEGIRRTRTPLLVQSASSHPVLVVLPAISWQGRNRVDDDGDGLPDTLSASGSAGLRRPFTGDGLPSGFAQHEALLLLALDRLGLRYDLTTDAALASGLPGPKLEGHRGVVLAGDERWLPARTADRLARFARQGGRVLTFGVDSLRRDVAIAGGRLVRPGVRATRDAFGASADPIHYEPADLTVYGEDQIEFFAGTDGLFPGWDAYELTTGLGGGKLLGAAGPADGQPVMLAERFGEGIVMRSGLPGFSARLGSDPELRDLLRRWWTLVSH